MTVNNIESLTLLDKNPGANLIKNDSPVPLRKNKYGFCIFGVKVYYARRLILKTIIKDRLLKPDGGNIPYIRNLNNEHRMVLLCLHGYVGSKNSSVIAALMESLDEKGIGVFTFDWPAHGESEAPDDSLTVENCLDDLDYVVNRLKRQVSVPISCFATSYGGYLATLYRNEHPEVFDRLILRSPALKMSKVFSNILTDEEFERMMSGECIVQGYERKINVGRSFYDSLLRHDAYDQAPPYPEKILILQGDADDVVDPADTIVYAEKNGIKIRLFEGAGHLYSNPGEKERIVAETERWL